MASVHLGVGLYVDQLYSTSYAVNYRQWRNYTWAIVGNAQVALWTAQVALPSDW